jgi:hypothetical protein
MLVRFPEAAPNRLLLAFIITTLPQQWPQV